MHGEAGKLASDSERAALRRHALKSEAVSRIKAMVELAKSEEGIPISASRLDADPHLVGVQNGILNLKTYEFREGHRDDYITKCCGTHYDPDATSPNWDAFTRTIFGGNQDVIAYLQRHSGYALTGSVAEEKADLWYGGGANGKTTAGETISQILGDYAVTSSAELLLPKKAQGGPTPEIARLKGVRLVLIKETQENDVLAEQRLKFITSNEKISARHLHENYFDFMPQRPRDTQGATSTCY
jgi:putative DNA primase/helicase